MSNFNFKGLTPEDLGDEFINLYVGATRKRFLVHKKLICDQSEFFNKAFNGRFKEGSTSIKELPEDDEEAMAHFISWLYTKKFLEIAGMEPMRPDLAKHLISLAVLADKICNRTLMNQVMDFIIKITNDTDSIIVGRSVEMIFQATPEGSMLRKFGLASLLSFPTDFYTYEDNGGVARNDIEFGKHSAIHTEILNDLSKFQSKYFPEITEGFDFLNPSREPFEISTCFYHTHAAGEECHLGTFQ